MENGISPEIVSYLDAIRELAETILDEIACARAVATEGATTGATTERG